jgi:Domain of unknown function (DUF4419)
LRPILSRFVSSFDGPPDLDFWGKICHYTRGGSGPSYLSGWITAFGAWSIKGEWQGSSSQSQDARQDLAADTFRLELDDVKYPILDTIRIPPGYCEVDVELDDNGELLDCTMVSGLVGQRIGGEGDDALSPVPAWFMFVQEVKGGPR